MSLSVYLLIAILAMWVAGLSVRGLYNDHALIKVLVCFVYGLIWPVGFFYSFLYWTVGGRDDV